MASSGSVSGSLPFGSSLAERLDDARCMNIVDEHLKWWQKGLTSLNQFCKVLHFVWPQPVEHLRDSNLNFLLQGTSVNWWPLLTIWILIGVINSDDWKLPEGKCSKCWWPVPLKNWNVLQRPSHTTLYSAHNNYHSITAAPCEGYAAMTLLQLTNWIKLIRIDHPSSILISFFINLLQSERPFYTCLPFSPTVRLSQLQPQYCEGHCGLQRRHRAASFSANPEAKRSQTSHVAQDTRESSPTEWMQPWCAWASRLKTSLNQFVEILRAWSGRWHHWNSMFTQAFGHTHATLQMALLIALPLCFRLVRSKKA